MIETSAPAPEQNLLRDTRDLGCSLNDRHLKDHCCGATRAIVSTHN